MPRLSPDDGDTWIGVKDPKKRKQIQDRLAQRARRRRLAEQKALVFGSGSDGVGHRTTAPTSALLSKHIRHSNSLVGQTGSEDLTTTTHISTLPTPLNMYSALWHNGALLGLTCGAIVPCLSKDLGPGIPEALRPTTLQLLTLHPPWIDRFPFPVMRDNFISLLGIIDTEDFLHDIFNIPSFTIEVGGPSWDPARWKIEAAFAQKWGFLFDSTLLDFSVSTPSSSLSEISNSLNPKSTAAT